MKTLDDTREREIEQRLKNWPKRGATPAGLFYTAVYQMSDGTTSTEYLEFSAALIFNTPLAL